MAEVESNKGFVGMLAVGLGICCGIPLLFGVGVFGALAGFGLDSWTVVAIGSAAAAIGLWRWLRNTRACKVPASAEVTEFQSSFDDRQV
jgi:hypothetical protein